jgi:hypothetical protein
MSGSQPMGRGAPQEHRTGRLSVAALRSAVPGRTWGGNGCGAPCDFCRVTLDPAEVEYEVEVELDGHSMLLHFHPRCHDTWQASRTRSADAAPPRGDDPPPGG